MPATQTMTGASKKSKSGKKPIGDLIAKSKSKATKGDVSSPPKPSRGGRINEESSVVESSKQKAQKVPMVDDVDVLISSQEKKTRKEKKMKREEKVVIEDHVVLRGAESTIEKRPKAKTKMSRKGGHEAEPEVAVKAPSKARTSSMKRKEPIEVFSPEPEVIPSDDGHLHGFTSDDDDSSDEDDAMEDSPQPEIHALNLPTIPKDDANVQRRIELAKRQSTGDLGVIYLGHLPHGFYEDQMRGYFSQFGNVTRLRLSRSKKSGSSKHYAFIEFDSSSVAKIVAETMDNYLLMGQILRCEVIPKDKVHPEIWVNANKKWKQIPTDRIERLKHDKPRTREEIEKVENRLIKRQTQKKRKLDEAGIKYDFEAVAYKKKAKVVEI